MGGDFGLLIRGQETPVCSDDGYDFINQEVPVTIENSWSFGNGYSSYGTCSPAAGNGNGFKMGSSKTGIRHLVQNNVAWESKANGFYANHSSGGNNWTTIHGSRIEPNTTCWRVLGVNPTAAAPERTA